MFEPGTGAMIPTTVRRARFRAGPAARAVLLAWGLSLAGAAHALAQNSVVIIPGIKIGVVGAERPQVLRTRLEPFRRRLSDDVGTSVEIVPMKDGQTLIDAIATKRVDYAILSASAYAMAWKLCQCIEPAAAPRSADGTLSFRAVMLVKSGSKAERVEDLKGASIATSDGRSVAGRLLPFAELAAAGLPPSAHFGRIETTTGPEAAVRLMLTGKVEAALAWSSLDGAMEAGYSRGTLRDMVDRKVFAMTDVRIVWTSVPIPHGPHAVRTDLPPQMRNRIREVLTHLRQDDPDAYDAVEPVMGGGFATIDHAAYQPLLVLVTPPEGEARPPAAPKPPG
jgi:phosphonate transport system substrate-binding protein